MSIGFQADAYLACAQQLAFGDVDLSAPASHGVRRPAVDRPFRAGDPIIDDG